MLEKFLKKVLKKQFMLYLLFGGFTTIIDMITYAVLVAVDINYLIATAIAWVFAVTFAYITNKLFVFKSKSENVIKEAFYFFSLRFTSLIVSLVLMYIMVDVINVNEFIAKLICNVFIVVSNYIFNKLFVFK